VKHHEICDMVIFICKYFIVIRMFRVRYGYTNAWHVAKWNVDCILYHSLYSFHFRLLSTSIILLKWNAFGGGGLIQVKKIL